MAANATLEFSVRGMTCQNCARHAAGAIRSVSGVAEARIDLPAGRAWVRWGEGQVADAAAVLAALQGVGFPATVLEPAAAVSGGAAGAPLAAGSPARASWFGGWGLNVLLGSALTVPLLLGDWVLQLGMERWFQWVAFGLALPVQVFCGARFYRGAWQQARAGRSNMDTLVSLGSTTAFGYSTVALLAGWPGHLYFLEAAAIITLISVGHWLETRASARAEDALRSLLTLAPATARLLGSGGVETGVPVECLAVGDRIVLRPGDRVPTDGDVVEGQSALDEALLTGESLPVEKGPGATVYGGTVNQNGRLVVRVTALGETTALQQIVAAVRRAQDSRADIQRLVDRVSNVFVPVVLVVAVLVAGWWGLAYEQARAWHDAVAPWLWHTATPGTPLAAAVAHAAAVLIVACPCAMGLATPIAIMAGANAAARRGILIRDGQALEKSGRLTTVVFDKTGTLTEGKVAVAAREDLRAVESRLPDLAGLAAGLAAPSNHPLSQAIARLAPAPAPLAARGGFRLPSLAGGGVAPSPWPATRPGLAFPPLLPGPAPARGPGGEVRGTGSPAVFSDWRERRGQGVEAQTAQGLLRLGSLTWLREAGVGTEPVPKFADNWADKGATVVGLAAGATLIGLFALRDAVKPGAPAVVQRLLAEGKRVYLITGDHPRTAAAVAQAVGIPAAAVFAGVRPEQKAARLRELQSQGQRVAFVGDGINDAPALEQADLGVAVSRASDVAREAADLVLLRSDLEAIPEAIGLAQATLRTIQQNLFWAFFYNGVAVPLAALGFLSPILCAAAMGASDLLVIGNALRLRRWRLR